MRTVSSRIAYESLHFSISLFSPLTHNTAATFLIRDPWRVFPLVKAKRCATRNNTRCNNTVMICLSKWQITSQATFTSCLVSYPNLRLFSTFLTTSSSIVSIIIRLIKPLASMSHYGGDDVTNSYKQQWTWDSANSSINSATKSTIIIY